MDWDDLEPIDLQPIDPGSDGESRFDRDRPRNRRRGLVWIGVVAAALAAWGAVALTNHGSRHQALPPPATTSVPTPATPVVQRITELAPRLWEGLRGVGSGRFAVVVDDRLYLLDQAGGEAETTLVPLPEGHATIVDQSGSSLLATTFQETLVSTTSSGTRTLEARDTAIRAASPSQWWLLSSDGTIRDDRGGGPRAEPTGLRVAAAVQSGFVAIDPPHGRWVLWSGPRITELAPSTYQIVGTGPTTVVFRYNCSIYSCSIEIDDTSRSTVVPVNMPGVPEFAAFSPDGTRLAMATTLGAVFIIDTKTGSAFSTSRARTTDDPSLPFAWTPDSRSLLVVRDDRVDVIGATDARITRTITGTVGLEQLVALP